MSTLSSSSAYSSRSSTTNIVSNRMSSIYGISPFFLYGNSYQTTDANYSGRAFSVSSTQTSQSGMIQQDDEGFSFTILEDATGKVIAVYHQNIFAALDYGRP